MSDAMLEKIKNKVYISQSEGAYVILTREEIIWLIEHAEELNAKYEDACITANMEIHQLQRFLVGNL